VGLIDLINIDKSYQDKIVLDGVSISINKNDKIAILGKNGEGKSTLLKILEGSLEIDNGKRVANKNIEIKMLAQAPKWDRDISVKQAIEEDLSELTQKKDEFNNISNSLSMQPDDKKLLSRQAELINYIDSKDAWNLDDKVDKTIEIFGLKELAHKNINILSGGEQRKVALASLVLYKPDILLLDEPTNHLDLSMVMFLEDMLTKNGITLIFISHDRYFINNISTSIIEIENRNTRKFTGGYTSYLTAKEEILNALQKGQTRLVKLLKKEQEWLNRGVKARLKRNEGRKKRLEEIKQESKQNPSEIKQIALQIQREKNNFNRTESINKQKMLFELENINKTIGNKILLKNFTTRILQNDSIAIVGKNGSGKSTLLKILTDQIEIDSGTIKRGDIKIGYFDQHRKMLDNNKNLIETFCPNGGDILTVQGKNIHIYGYLKNFLFPKEYLNHKIGLLSGGEKNRVALALLFANKYDCLLLDEPTNDLDIQTINILEEYLINFSGTIIFVSHDRFFVDKIAKKLFVFKGNGEIEHSYKTFSEQIEEELEDKEVAKLIQKNQKPKKSKPTQIKKDKLTYKENIELDNLPDNIDKLESKILELEECLQNEECYKKIGISIIGKELEEKQSRLEESMQRFIELDSKLIEHAK
jgi:ATP-binding cassette subfamily F protein uup